MENTNIENQGQTRENSCRTNRTSRSNASVILAKKQAELDVAEQMAELERNELEIAKNLLRKKLELSLATIDLENEGKQNSTRSNSSRTQSLVFNQNRGKEKRVEAVENQEQNNTNYPDPARTDQWVNDHNQMFRDVCSIPEHSRIIINRTEMHEPNPRPAAQCIVPTTNKMDTKDNDMKLLAREIKNLRHPIEKKLPVFSGDTHEWLAFKAAFVDTKKYLSETENIARLRLCLKGEAKETVASLLYTQVSSEEIMNTLEQRFGRPELILEEEIRAIKELPKLNDSSEQLCKFASKVKNCVSTIQTLKRPEHLYNLDLVKALKSKMTHLKSRWLNYMTEQENMKNFEEPELVKLSKFLEREALYTSKYWVIETQRPQTSSNIMSFKHHYNSGDYNRGFKSKTHYIEDVKNKCYISNMDGKEKAECPYCTSDNHRTIHECEKFKKLHVAERWNWAKEIKYCFKCLRSKHRREYCRAKICGVNGCKMPHHYLLHAPPKEHNTVGTATDVEAAEIATASGITTCSNDIPSNQVLIMIIPVTLKGPKGCVKTHALLDGGSTLTLLKHELAEKIGVSGRNEPLVVTGINSTTTDTNSQRVNLQITGPAGVELELRDARTVRNLELCPQTITSLDNFTHLKDIPVEDYCYYEAKADLLIGQNNWHLMISKEVRSGRYNEPVGTLTPLGWVIHGFRSPTTHAVNFVGHVQENEITELVEIYFQIESIGISTNKKENPENKRAIEILQSTSRKVEGGKRWETGLLWKEDNPKMPESYKNVCRRLHKIEKILDNDKEYGEKYVNNVDNFFNSGYAGSCDHTESIKKWYLPHFGVTNVNKPGKLRIVFDAANRTNGTSLNDQLLTGPDLLLSLLGVLFKFREGKVAISADIKEMFLQVRIRPEDRPAQRFLWRGYDRHGPIREYEMKSLIFGAASSPCTAIFIKNRNADDYIDQYPDAVAAIKTRFYMDDYLHSVQSEEKAMQFIKEVSLINQEGGFILTQWASNSSTVMQSIDPEKRAIEGIELDFNTKIKILGLRWNPKGDDFSFNLNMAKIPKDIVTGNQDPTKREILKLIMSIFDPLGFITPITIQGKVILQQVWRSGIDWDQKLNEPENLLWKKWLIKLENSWSCRIPRCYDVNSENAEIELHTFCDASEKAFAAVAYWRFTYADGTIKVSFIASKSRVTPLKPLTIPRLELQAALIGSRLAQTVVHDHDMIQPIRRYFWSDSSTVLAWIRKDPRSYKAYVSHRLAEIADLTQINEWRWVPTSQNVADDATRELEKMKIEDRWFTGPSFLYNLQDQWPDPGIAVTSISDSELKKDSNFVAVIPIFDVFLPDINRFSKWLKLIRSTAYVFLYLDKLRQSNTGLEQSHLDKAENIWIKKSQGDSFSSDISKLRDKKPIDKDSRLKKLNPYLDSDGILRLRGRANKIDEIDLNVINPIILDGKHAYTQLLIQFHHEQHYHANTETVINFLRQRYWILKIRPTVKIIKRMCQMCRVRHSRIESMPAGDLPQARLAHHQRPFTHCGVDYFGPMNITIGRRHEKRYGALFTCLTTRAVHIELAASLTSDSAILALRRMMARRGSPKVMYSDNGTNFHGAWNELKRAIKELHKSELKTFMLNHGINWKFIPPAAPHMGGSWERLVRSIKTALHTTLKEQAPHEEVLLTLLLEAEHIVNSRPLTHVSVDPDDKEALTPNHFLLGSTSGVLLPGIFDDGDLCRRSQWKKAQRLADIFWNRWIKEYLPTLLPRTPGTNQPDLQIGDLVVIVDANLPRNVWPKGLIEKTFPGPDGRTRVVDVRTARGVLRRPVIKLVRLQID